MAGENLRPLIVAFALVSIYPGPALQAQNPQRPQTYSLTMSFVAGAATMKVDRSGAKERVDLTVPAGMDNPKEVHQVLLFDSQTHQAYAEDPATHACYSTPYPSTADLGNYDPFLAPPQQAGSPDKMLPGAKPAGTETINGLTTELYEGVEPGPNPANSKLWWSRTYNLPIKMEEIVPGAPPEVAIEIKRLVTTAPPASLFAAPSGCKEAQGTWTGGGFEASGEKEVKLGAVAPKPQPSPFAAPSSLPTNYTIGEVSTMTDASMLTGHPSTLKIYRNASKERIDLWLSPKPGAPPDFHQRFLFDFAAHRAYLTLWNGNMSDCSWIKYPPLGTPYDPVISSGLAWFIMTRMGTVKKVGPQTLNGIPAEVEEVSVLGMPDLKIWIAQKQGFAVKFLGPKLGPVTEGFEVKKMSFGTPPASFLATPTDCSQKGQWSIGGVGLMSGHAERTITVPTSNPQQSTPGGAASEAPNASKLKHIAAETGGNPDDFADASVIPENTFSTSCTVLFRIVRAGTMAPITSGFNVGLSRNSNASGSPPDVTSQFQNGILRIENPPRQFSLSYSFPNGGGGASDISTQCFRPRTVLLLVITNPNDVTQGADFLWVKSGKYATIAASQATGAASAPANLVTNGDFESGNTGFTTGYTYGNVNGPTAYWIGKNASQAPGAYPDWYNGGDHTTGTGNMLVANGATSAATPVWEEAVPVTPNTTYTFSYWGAEVDHDSSSLPHLDVRINGSPVGDNSIQEKSPDNGGSWQNFTFTWNSGSSTSAHLAIFDANTDIGWNDFALDDVRFVAR